MSKFIIVLTTTDSEQKADEIADKLLKERFAACVQIFPITSKYWWKGKIEYQDEYVILAKTIKKNIKKVETEVKKTHSYEVPCIMEIGSSSNKEFEDWVKKEVR